MNDVAARAIDAEDLGQRLEQGPLPADEVVAIVASIASSIEADLAAGRPLHDLAPPGAIGFLSPERLRRPERVDLASDLWALAVLAYCALTGAAPFAGATTEELAKSLRKGAFAAPSKLAPGLPIEIDAFFAQAFARDPSARFSSARSMAAAFAERARTAGRPTAPLLLQPKRRIRKSARGRGGGSGSGNLERTVRVEHPELAGASWENLQVTRPARVPEALLALTREGGAEPRRPARWTRRRIARGVALALLVGALCAAVALWIAERRAAPRGPAEPRPAPSMPW